MRRLPFTFSTPAASASLSGKLGVGGGAFKPQGSNTCSGGGGGGGYYGGGAGCLSGGAGGASFVARAPLAQVLEQHNGVRSGQGLVTISWMVPEQH